MEIECQVGKMSLFADSDQICRKFEKGFRGLQRMCVLNISLAQRDLLGDFCCANL